MKRMYSNLYIYKSYRDYMRRKYGPGPWVDVEPQDRFYEWRRRNFGDKETPEYGDWKEVYVSEVKRRRHDKPGRSSRRRGRRQKTYKNVDPEINPNARRYWD